MVVVAAVALPTVLLSLVAWPALNSQFSMGWDLFLKSKVTQCSQLKVSSRFAAALAQLPPANFSSRAASSSGRLEFRDLGFFSGKLAPARRALWVEREESLARSRRQSYLRLVVVVFVWCWSLSLADYRANEWKLSEWFLQSLQQRLLLLERSRGDGEPALALTGGRLRKRGARHPRLGYWPFFGEHQRPLWARHRAKLATLKWQR